MGHEAARARPRLAGFGLLAAVLLTATASATVPVIASAAPAPAPGGVSLTDVRVTKSGFSAILTARAVGGNKIDPASVRATIGGVRTPLSVKPLAQERRVTTLLIDTSGSMGAAGMQTVVRAADAFLASVPTDVYVGAIAFSTAPRVVASPTLNRAAVRAAIAGLTSQGETSLYDGLAATLAQLGTSGDRSFILLSDGGDTRSRHTLAQTLAALSKSGVRTQVVGFKTDETQGSVLSNLASAGHGSVVAAGNSAAVSAAFTVAAQALESQIRVFFTAPPSSGGIQSLVVSAAAGGRTLTSLTSVDLAALSLPPSASPAPSTAPASGVRSAPQPAAEDGPAGAWVLVVAFVAIFFGLAGLVATVAMPTYVSRRQRRVDAMEGYLNGVGPSPLDERSAVSAISASLINMGDKLMDSRNSTPKTQRLLERSDLPFRLGEWAVLRVVAIVVGVAAGLVLIHGGPTAILAGGCLGGLAGVIGPALFLKLAASRRAKKFEAQLPDVLTLVASSLSTGFSLLQALDAVARDAAQPSAKEFSRALAETRIGTDLNESLEHLADRMDSSNLRWTGMAINIQRQVGGNLGETLRNTAATLRDRESLRRHVSALSAEGKLSAYILIALPIGIFFYMMGVNRAYVELLWTTMIGIGMLGAGLVSLAIGVFWMRKVVIVEV